MGFVRSGDAFLFSISRNSDIAACWPRFCGFFPNFFRLEGIFKRLISLNVLLKYYSLVTEYTRTEYTRQIIRISIFDDFNLFLTRDRPRSSVLPVKGFIGVTLSLHCPTKPCYKTLIVFHVLRRSVVTPNHRAHDPRQRASESMGPFVGIPSNYNIRDS